MSTTPPAKAFFGAPVFTYADAIRFFKGTKAVNACYACGHEMWNVSTTEDVCDVIRKPSAFIEKADSFQIELECDRCGLIRVHNAQALALWLAENPSVEGQVGASEE